ncbi:MAG: type II secretion system GspH family protein [bacterium]|nr:type II secretion system GspH family protein [bacterium]
MKKGFTLVEVTILLVIFLIVAFLVAPLSMDDTMQAKNTSKWRSVQPDFENIFHYINTQKTSDENFEEVFLSVLSNEYKDSVDKYKISFLNGKRQNEEYQFDNYKLTQGNAILAVKMTKGNSNDDLKGILMYDVNGTLGPNTWGKDVFGMKIYENRFEPFGKNEAIKTQKQDCSRNGTGLFCSNYYLIGGNFE